jgi:catechol 2,3-dioxygenase-like lactoylglutathione lyase family enzyme
MPHTECPIAGLRYIALAVENFDETLAFYSGLWGLEVVAAEAGLAYLASPADPAAYILRLRQAEAKRVDLAGLSCPDAAAVDALATRLRDADVRIDQAPAPLTSPGGGYGLRFFDCDGRLIEVSADVAERTPTGSRLKGIPLGLSHIVFNTTDILKTKSFYEDVVGLKLSDWLEDFMCFLRCATTQHHIVALASGPHVALNHVAYEVGSIDAQMRGTGRMMRAGHKVIWGPGRHGAGDNTFSYFLDPAGNICEYTTEMEHVDDATWSVRRFETTPEAQEQWGTGGLVTDGMIPAMFNSPDAGLWQSSPV